jgi:hypothetical protein
MILIKEKTMDNFKEDHIPNSICTLRALIEYSKNTIYKTRFEEAKRLAQSIFDGGDKYVPLPYFTKHDASHCAAIEKYLNQIIWGGGKPGQHDFAPTAEEAMYLLSAAWLHDIGMIYGLFENEDPNDLQDYNRVEELRDEHELRTIRYIHDIWKAGCTWEEDEKTWLTNICAFHRRRYPISTFE